MLKTFHSFDRDLLFMKWAFLIMGIVFSLGLTGGFFYMNRQIEISRNQVVVLDRNNQTFIGTIEGLTVERRKGQLVRNVEIFWMLFWNVSQERDNLEHSINMAAEMGDHSVLRLYEQYYEIQGMASFLYENSATSHVVIENVELDMTIYPYRGHIYSIHELETPYGSSRRRMDATFQIKNYPVSYSNPAGAMIMEIEVINEDPL